MRDSLGMGEVGGKEKEEEVKCGHLFNGIGGFALAAHWMGWSNVMHCEIDPFCNKVMNYHFPNSYQHEDIRTTDFTIWRGKLDLITGGFPCQPYSTAGKRKGKEDDRHLWPQMLRAIREIQPGWIVGENVRGLTNWNGGLVFDEVQADLEAEGYEVLPFLLPAAGVNAPHRRDRIWFVAHSNYLRINQQVESEKQPRGAEIGATGKTTCSETIANTIGNGHQRANGFGKDRCEKETGEGEEQREERNKENRERLWPDVGGNVAAGVTTNPNSGQRCEGGLHSKGSETTTGHACTCDTRDAAAGITADSNNIDRRSRTGREDGEKANYSCGDWQDFPTQPPICSGNDGLSIGLADWPVPSKSGTRILKGKQAYGRWRKESIKALGNAIVPQVVYQIFKAIEQWEVSQD